MPPVRINGDQFDEALHFDDNQVEYPRCTVRFSEAGDGDINYTCVEACDYQNARTHTIPGLELKGSDGQGGYVEWEEESGTLRPGLVLPNPRGCKLVVDLAL